MRKTKIVRLLAVLLAVVLMLSAIPFGLSITSGELQAASQETKHNESVQIDEGKVINKEAIVETVSSGELTLQYWISDARSDDVWGRRFRVDILPTGGTPGDTISEIIKKDFLLSDLEFDSKIYTSLSNEVNGYHLTYNDDIAADIDEEDYNWWVDICEDVDLDPTQRFIKRVRELGNVEDYDDPNDYYDWIDLISFREFGD